MINKILGKRIFKGKILESTSTICKIRNSDKIRVITEKVSGEREEQDFTGECDLDTEEGVTLLRNFLEKRTDLTCMSSDENIRCVDIGFPIHFLKVNYTLTVMFVYIYTCICGYLINQSNINQNKNVSWVHSCLARTPISLSVLQLHIKGNII